MSDVVVWPIRSHFLDSGAFTLRNKVDVNYREYMDEYATFIKDNLIAIDLYANVDVIASPELTWDNQKYLENEHGLKPIPLVHYGEDFKWIVKYIEAGYQYLGIGGVSNKKSLVLEGPWLESCFEIICSTPKRLPVCMTHGFGVGGTKSMLRYPWYSVDTTRWMMLGSRGYFAIPKYRNGKFIFDVNPTIVKVGNTVQKWKDHLKSLGTAEYAVVKEWADFIGIDLEKIQENPASWSASYLKFYEEFRKNAPSFPKPYQNKRLGFFDKGYKFNSVEFPESKLKIYYSGGGVSAGLPEVVLERRAMVMLSFFDVPNTRFRRILEARRVNGPVAFPGGKKRERRRVAANAVGK